MKLILLLLVALVVFAVAAPGPDPAPPLGAPKLQHVVSFKFKEETGPSQIREVEQAFVGLQKKIQAIRHLEWGINISPEKLDKGFTHCFILTFDTAADRDAYLVHPDHKAFGGLVGPVLADVMVIDFWAK